MNNLIFYTAFADLLVPGPNYAGDFDGRELAFRDFLLIDPSRAFNDPEGTLTALPINERELSKNMKNLTTFSIEF